MFTDAWVKRLRQLLRALLGPANFNEVAVVHGVLKSSRGVMVDVGAHHGGTVLSFAESGWTVYAFEPDPVNRKVLDSATAGFRNVTVVPYAVSNRTGRSKIYRADVSSGISALTPFHTTHQEAGEVEVVTLAHFLQEAGVERVNFLKVDTEGYDLFVLQGFPWERMRPHVVVCEFEDRKTTPLGYSYHDLAGFLSERGYEVLVSEWHPVVEYGQPHRWRRLRRYPHELVDTDSWGNLIAVRPDMRGAMKRRATWAGWRLALREHALRALRWNS